MRSETEPVFQGHSEFSSTRGSFRLHLERSKRLEDLQNSAWIFSAETLDRSQKNWTELLQSRLESTRAQAHRRGRVMPRFLLPR